MEISNILLMANSTVGALVALVIYNLIFKRGRED